MNAGQSCTVTVTMKNTGRMAWDETNRIRLGGIGDGNGEAAKFGPARIGIPAGYRVLSGAQYTFTFTMTAPATPGSYTPKYRMVWEGNQWFGAQLPQIIKVTGQTSVQTGPNAQFTASATQGNAPLIIQFTDLSSSTGTTLYKWDMNNDGIADYTTKNPSHTYMTEGTYTVRLTVYDAGGSSSEVKTDYITLSAPGTKILPTPVPTSASTPVPTPAVVSTGAPKAQFTASTTQGQSPLTVQFTSQSTGAAPMTYKWDFSDGEGNLPENSQQNPQWRFWEDAGTSYTVTLTVTNAYGSDTIVKENYINLGTAGQPVVTPTPKPTVTLTPTPKPTVTLTPIPTPTSVSGKAPRTQFTASTTQGQTPLTVQFTDRSVTTGTTLYKWDINNDGRTDYTTKNPSHTYMAAGTYSVKLIVTNAYGSDTEVKTEYITVTSANSKSTPTPTGSPSAQFSASTTDGKTPLTVQFTDQSVSTATTTYMWDVNNDGTTDYTTKNPSHTYQSVGSYTVKLTVTNAYGSDSEIKGNYITVSSEQPYVPTGSGSYGSAANPTGNPIGGGAGYTRIVTGTEAGVKYTVSTKDQLVTALKSAKSGEIVFVTGSAVIDLTGTPSVTIPAGVTLASDRGRAGSAGGLIKRTKNLNGGWEEPMFIAGGDYVRVTGLRLQGEMYPQDYGNKAGQTYESDYLVGIYAENRKGFEVDNCELYGWAWATISLRGNTNTPIPFIHHNYIHHNQARGEGYGVCMYGGNALIEANLFDYNRHDVTGAGMRGEQYEARYNHHLGHGNAIGASNYDVHQDEETGTGAAGAKFLIHHNTIDTGIIAAVHIRARPTTGVYVDHNIINSRATDTGVPGGLPIYQTNSNQNMFVTNNYWMGKLYTGSSGIVYYQ
jgi:PKD repeat protein